MQRLKTDLPPLNFLIAFEAAARRQSFAAAAEELNVAQSAVSRQIRLLEESLGTALFRRAHRSVQLTPEGRDYQHMVAMVFDHIANATRDLRRAPAGAGLVVATDQSVAALWLLPRLADFRRRHPEVALRLIASDLAADCLGDDVDLAVIHGHGEWPGFDAALFFEEEVFPVCSPAYLEAEGPVEQADDLARRVTIEMEYGDWHWLSWRAWLTEQGVHAPLERPQLVMNSYPLILRAASDGLGVALGWRHLVEDRLADGSLVRPLPETLVTDLGYHVLMPAQAAPNPLGALFRDWLYDVRSTLA